ncbi:MAG: succinate dehydrogenase assembly factor 2 [Albidovulum sp.]
MIATDSTEIKRLTMRSWRRGMKEMDLVLGPFADAHLGTMGGEGRGEYDRLLSENDPEIYAWITGAAEVPERYAALIGQISAFAFSGGKAGR